MLERLRRIAVRDREAVATTRRRPGDLVRVVVAAALLTAFALHAGDPTAPERAVIRFFGSLPDDAHTFFLLLYDLVALWAVLLLATAVLLLRRWRLARDLLVAGGLAWVAGRLLAFFVRDTDLWNSLQITFELSDAPRFPLVRIGMAVAMVIVASPALTRPSRVVGQVIVGLLALAGLYLGKGSVNDLLGAVVLGWGVAALVRYAFGTPARRPTVRQVEQALAELGSTAHDVRMADEQPIGRAIFLADDDGPLRVTALGRDEADAQLLARAWRYVAYRDAPPTLLPTRRQQVEHEAYTALLARDSGVHAPQVVVAGSSGPVAVLVERVPAGTALFDTDAQAVTDGVLDDLWRQVALLHHAGIAHGKLDGRSVLVDGDHGVITGFEWATGSARPGQAAGDVAQLLAATTAVVGQKRAVAAAVRGVGPDLVREALPHLQPVALSGWTHDALGGRKGLDDVLGQLREAGARATNSDPPELRSLYRVHPRSLLMAVGALIAVATLLSRVGDPEQFWDTVRDADWVYVGLAFVLGIATDVAFGITFLGNVPQRIPIWPSIELQSSMSFSNLAVPVAADTALQVRFLQKQGLDLASAVAAGGFLSSISEIVVQLGLFFVALWLAPDSIDFGRVDTGQIVVVVLIVVFLVGVAAAVLFGVRRLRHAVLPPIRRAAGTMWHAVKTPGRLALLVVGNVVAQCLYAGSLLACLAAFGQSVDFWTLLALNIGISTIASLVPIPGGGTAVSAIGLAGMLTAFGVPESIGAAAVVTHQLAVSDLPAIPGWFATRDLLRKGML